MVTDWRKYTQMGIPGPLARKRHRVTQDEERPRNSNWQEGRWRGPAGHLDTQRIVPRGRKY
jgi:hypothetical protein